MNKRCIVISILGLLVSFLAISQRSETRRNKDILEGIKYNESIFLVSNYSVERTAHVKSASLEELLTSGVEGFYFHIKRDGHSGKLLLREPDGSFLTSSSCHPKIFIKEFCNFLVPCHQHCLRVNVLVQR